VCPSRGIGVIAAGARGGILRVYGIHVSIDARDDESILAAARALEPMPS
jgi:hypothetical protein